MSNTKSNLEAKSSLLRGILIRLAAVALAVAVSLLVVELGLRILDIGYPQLTQYDFDRGKSYVPNAEGWHRSEGEAYIRINSRGLRDHEHDPTPAPNTFRVAVIGDSFTAGLHVDLEEIYWWIAGEELNNCSALEGRKVEIINFGIGGSGTGQHLITLKKYALAYQPHLVILGMHTYTDIRDNSLALSQRPLRPYYRLNGEKLVLDNSFRKNTKVAFSQSYHGRLLYGLSARLHLVQVLRQARWAYKARRFQADRRRSMKKISPDRIKVLSKLGVGSMIYIPDAGQEWEEAWQVTEALVERMAEVSNRSGASFILVTLSNTDQGHPNPQTREETKELLGVSDLFYPERRLGELATRIGFQHIPLAPEFQNYATEKNIYLHGFPNTSMGVGHWNENGHRLAGEIIAREICATPAHSL